MTSKKASNKDVAIKGILAYLKAYKCAKSSEVYAVLIKDGKSRNYMTSSKFNSMVAQLIRKGILEKTGDVLCIAKGYRSLTVDELFQVFNSLNWPNDLVDVLA